MILKYNNLNPISGDASYRIFFRKFAKEKKKSSIVIFSKKEKNLIDIYGVGKQTRDILFSDDVVRLYYMAIKDFDALKGEAFNIGGGPNNSISLLELFDVLEEKTGNKIQYRINSMRKNDQKVYISKIDKIYNSTAWEPTISIDEGIDLTLDWIRYK